MNPFERSPSDSFMQPQLRFTALGHVGFLPSFFFTSTSTITSLLLKTFNHITAHLEKKNWHGPAEFRNHSWAIILPPLATNAQPSPNCNFVCLFYLPALRAPSPASSTSFAAPHVKLLFGPNITASPAWQTLHPLKPRSNVTPFSEAFPDITLELSLPFCLPTRLFWNLSHYPYHWITIICLGVSASSLESNLALFVTHTPVLSAQCWAQWMSKCIN